LVVEFCAAATALNITTAISPRVRWMLHMIACRGCVDLGSMRGEFRRKAGNDVRGKRPHPDLKCPFPLHSPALLHLTPITKLEQALHTK